jgi:hypothetical protein
VYRRTGIVLLLLGVSFSVLLLWLPVRYFTGYQVGKEQVSRIYLPCGSAIGIAADQFDPAIRTPGERIECIKRARSRILYVVFVGPLLLLGLYGVFRGPYPHRKLGE